MFKKEYYIKSRLSAGYVDPHSTPYACKNTIIIMRLWCWAKDPWIRCLHGSGQHLLHRDPHSNRWIRIRQAHADLNPESGGSRSIGALVTVWVRKWCTMPTWTIGEYSSFHMAITHIIGRWSNSVTAVLVRKRCTTPTIVWAHHRTDILAMTLTGHSQASIFSIQ